MRTEIKLFLFLVPLHLQFFAGMLLVKYLVKILGVKIEVFSGQLQGFYV